MVGEQAPHHYGLGSILASMPFTDRICGPQTLLQNISVLPPQRKPMFDLICNEVEYVAFHNCGGALGEVP